MRLWTPHVTVLSGALFLAVFPSSPSLADTDPEKDAQIVYCLSEQRRPDFIRAAVNLGIGRPVTGRPDLLAMDTEPARIAEFGAEVTRTAEQLLRELPKDFTRVCGALIKANSGPSGGEGGAGGLWSSAFLTLLGAAAALIGQQVERRTTYRITHHEALNSAIYEYARAAKAYLEGWQANPKADHEAVAAAHAELIRVVHRLPLGPAPRKEARELCRALPLDDPLPKSPDPLSPEEEPPPGETRKPERDRRKERAELELVELEKVLGRLERLMASRVDRWTGRTANPADPGETSR